MPKYLVVCTPEERWEEMWEAYDHWVPLPIDTNIDEGLNLEDDEVPIVISAEHAVKCANAYLVHIEDNLTEDYCEVCGEKFSVLMWHNQWPIGYEKGRDHICWSIVR